MITDNQFFLEGIWFFARILIVIFLGLYFIFSLIIVRQVNLMTETVETTAAPFLKILAIMYAITTLILLILYVLNL